MSDRLTDAELDALEAEHLPHDGIPNECAKCSEWEHMPYHDEPDPCPVRRLIAEVREWRAHDCDEQGMSLAEFIAASPELFRVIRSVTPPEPQHGPEQG